jgi:flagellar biosynthesis/type III secretory pathway chaperone
MKEAAPTPEKAAPPQERALYEALLRCLEDEWQALVATREEAILALAAEKEQILQKLIGLNRDRDTATPEAEPSGRLKRQVAQAQARNHRLITSALETIQDFLGLLQAAPPGIYQAAGKVEASPGSSFFHRQA